MVRMLLPSLYLIKPSTLSITMPAASGRFGTFRVPVVSSAIAVLVSTPDALSRNLVAIYRGSLEMRRAPLPSPPIVLCVGSIGEPIALGFTKPQPRQSHRQHHQPWYQLRLPRSYEPQQPDQLHAR